MMNRIAFPLLAALAASGCSGRDGANPSDIAAPGLAASVARGDERAGSSRSGTLHLKKECSVYTGLAGSYCTITSSNLSEILVGSREFALKDADLVANTLDGDGVLYVRDGQLALNHCTIFNLTATSGRIGTCRFSGGIGQLRGFHANVVVSIDKDDPNVADFDGPYSFSKDGDRD